MDLSFRKTKRYILGLDCLVGRERLVIPSAAVEHIIDYEVSPLPSTRPEIGGRGVHMGQPIVSLRLCGWGPPPLGLRSAKGVLLAWGDRRAGWVVEVSEIIAIVEGAMDPLVEPSNTGPADRWLLTAITRNGSRVTWLDVDTLLDEMLPIAARYRLGRP